jgi:hypothetical protein
VPYCVVQFEDIDEVEYRIAGWIRKALELAIAGAV